MKTEKYNICFLMITLFFFNAFCYHSPSFGEDVPIIPLLSEWEIITEQVRELKTEKENLGWFIQQDILSQSHKNAKVILLTGPGPGELYIPSGNINNNDRPIGFGAEYSTLEIGGLRAVFENYPYAGMAVSINIPGKGTLTIESRTLSRKAIIALAEEYVIAMNTLTYNNQK